MNFFKASTEQARQAFLAMPMQSRVIAAMLAVVIGIGFAFLVRGEGSGGKEYLFGGQAFAPQELAAVERSFSRASLGDWKRDGSRILIPSEFKSDYLAALDDSAALPYSMRSRVQDAIDATTVFDPSDLRESRESVAKEQEVADTIMAFPEVNFAKVKYSRGERMGLARQPIQSCSVFIQPVGSAPLARPRMLAIKDLVRASYAGLNGDDVMVVDANSATSSSIMDEEDPMIRKAKEAENLIEQKIRKLLIAYPAKIGVSATIDPTMEVEKTTFEVDAEPTNLYTKSQKVKSTTSTPPDRGVPGTAANTITNRSASLEPVETSNVVDDKRESRGVAGQTWENSRLAALQVQRIKVSIGLPTSFYRTQYRKELLAEDPNAGDTPFDETEFLRFKERINTGIQALVAPMLPTVAAGEDPLPNVTVSEQVDPPIAGPPPSQTAKMALTWLADSWQTMALVALGLVALMVARSAAKGNGSSSPADFKEGFGLELPQPPASEEEEAEKEGDSMTITGSSLKDELYLLVESNPEVAANVIRGWVGDAA